MCLSSLSEVLVIRFSDLQISLLITTLNRLTSLFFQEGKPQRKEGEIHTYTRRSSIFYPRALTMGSI